MATAVEYEYTWEPDKESASGAILLFGVNGYIGRIVPSGRFWDAQYQSKPDAPHKEVGMRASMPEAKDALIEFFERQL